MTSINGPNRNQCCKKLGGQNLHPYKRPINFFSADLTIIAESIKRKNVRGPENRVVSTIDQFYPAGLEKFVPFPNTTVIRAPLSNTADILNAGLYPSGAGANLGNFIASNGVEGGNSYRVDANNQGLYIRNPMKAMPLDQGEFSVYLNGHDAGGSGTNNYILSVEDNLVLRWESGSQELRLYPDLTNFPSDHIGIPLTSGQWYSTAATWHKYTIQWSYEDQDWQLFIDTTTKGTRTGSNTIPYPVWDAISNVSIFADINNQNNVYHDAQFIGFGPIITDVQGIGEGCCFQIDASTGTNTTYGRVTGNFSGGTVFHLEDSYKDNSLRLWRNTDEQIVAVDFTESDPANNEYTITTPAIEGESFIASYIRRSCKCPDPHFVIAVTSGSGSVTNTPSSAYSISGTVGPASTLTLPFPYISGKLMLKWQGMPLTQGDGSEWSETDPYLGTVKLNDTIEPNSVITAVFMPELRYLESSNDTISGTVDGSNDIFRSSYPFIPWSLESKLNGQQSTDGVDYTTISNRSVEYTDTVPSGSFIGFAYDILFNEDADGIISQSVDDSDSGIVLSRDLRMIEGDTTSGDIILQMPNAYTMLGRAFQISKRSGSNLMHVSGSGSQLMNGVPVITISADNDTIVFEPNSIGNGWVIT